MNEEAEDGVLARTGIRFTEEQNEQFKKTLKVLREKLNSIGTTAATMTGAMQNLDGR